MTSVKYKTNWGGKLDKDEFTTIRSWSPEKEKYYRERIGWRFSHVIDNKEYCQAYLEDVVLTKFHLIPASVLMADTGLLDLEEIKRIFRRFGISERGACLILKFKKRALYA